MTWVKASYDSIHGTIKSHWTREGNILTLNVTIPVNTRARVYLPASDADAIRESDRPLSQTPEIILQTAAPGSAVLDVPSGDYRFTMPLQS